MADEDQGGEPGGDQLDSEQDFEMAEVDPDQTMVNDELDAGIDDGISDAQTEDGKKDDDDDDYNDEDEDDEDYEPDPLDKGDRTDLPQAEWSEEMDQTEEMMKVGLCVHVNIRIAICIECRSVIKPSDLHHHIVKTHSMSATISFCEELQAKYHLQLDPYNVRPGSIINAIYGLDLVKGYTTCDSCGYACGTDKAMKRHIKASDTCKTYRKRYVQTFQPSSNRMYFGVETEPREDPAITALDPVVYLRKKFSPLAFCDIPIRSPKATSCGCHFFTLNAW